MVAVGRAISDATPPGYCTAVYRIPRGFLAEFCKLAAEVRRLTELANRPLIEVPRGPPFPVR